MLNFKPLELSDQNLVSAYYKKKNVSAAQYSFAANYVWKMAYPIEICESDEFLFVKVQAENGFSFLCPMGEGDFSSAVMKIVQWCKEHQFPIQFHGILEEDCERLEEIFGTKIVIKSNRDDDEYVYESKKLATLSGKKYHGKRNHIKRFMDSDWSYEALSEENSEECMLMQRKWCHENGCASDDSKIDEGCAAMLALRNFTTLGFRGGILRQNGAIVSYTIGEPVGNDTFAIHFEKAFSTIQGAYPVINQLFVQAEAMDFRYINREEDAGSEGLRKAKLSYYPAFLLEKYTAEMI